VSDILFLGVSYVYNFRISLIMYYLGVSIPDEILRCAQDDIPSRGKERGKEGGCAAFFSLLPPDNWLSS
jgi:hypothetical protein